MFFSFRMGDEMRLVKSVESYQKVGLEFRKTRGPTNLLHPASIQTPSSAFGPSDFCRSSQFQFDDCEGLPELGGIEHVSLA